MVHSCGPAVVHTSGSGVVHSGHTSGVGVVHEGEASVVGQGCGATSKTHLTLLVLCFCSVRQVILSLQCEFQSL